MKNMRLFLCSHYPQCFGTAGLLVIVAVAAILWPLDAGAQHPAVPKLTLVQVEQLVSNKVPDTTMSAQIQSRGLAFTPTPEIVEALRAKGAGALTLAAIKALIQKAGTSRPVVKAEPSRKISISPGVAVGLLLQKTSPIYPPIAKAARVSGTVVLQATISKTGSMEDLHVVSGPPLLQGAALDAVKNWRYRPYLLEGKPVDVETTINVIFTLGDDMPQTSNATIKPRDSGPSLAETMQFIQDKISQQGQTAFVTTVNNQNQPGVITRMNQRFSVAEVIADPASCTLHASGKGDLSFEDTSGGKTVAAGAYDQHFQVAGAVAFKDVEKITVENLESVINRGIAEKGHPELTATMTTPFLFYVVLSSSKPVFSSHVSTTTGSQAPSVTDKTEKEINFVFRDEEMANRVAKAMRHAVELCGGGNKEPF